MGDELDALYDRILGVLRDALGNAKVELKSDWELDGKRIAEEAARYLLKERAGDPDAAQCLLHLQAQAELLAGRIAVRESERAQAVLKQIFDVVLPIAATILKTLV